MSEATLHDADLRLFDHRLTDKSRRKVELLMEDLNLEIASMPIALRNPFRIVRDIVIEVLYE
jgi:hypothetical protein